MQWRVDHPPRSCAAAPLHTESDVHVVGDRPQLALQLAALLLGDGRGRLHLLAHGAHVLVDRQAVQLAGQLLRLARVALALRRQLPQLTARRRQLRLAVQQLLLRSLDALLWGVGRRRSVGAAAGGGQGGGCAP